MKTDVGEQKTYSAVNAKLQVAAQMPREVHRSLSVGATQFEKHCSTVVPSPSSQSGPAGAPSCEAGTVWAHLVRKPSTMTVPPLPLPQCLLGGPRAGAWSQGLSGPFRLQSGPHSASPPLTSENEGSTGQGLNLGEEGNRHVPMVEHTAGPTASCSIQPQFVLLSGSKSVLLSRTSPPPSLAHPHLWSTSVSR